MVDVPLSLALILAALILALLVALLRSRSRLSKFRPIVDLKREQERIRASIDVAKRQEEQAEAAAQARIDELQRQAAETQGAVAVLQRELRPLEDEMELMEHGLYEPLFDFDASDGYKEALQEIRQRQKSMIREKSAVSWSAEWSVEGSRSKGKQMENQYTRLMLRAFNGECDALIAKVKYNNIHAIERRMQSLYDAVNKLGKTNKCQIDYRYLQLKLDELHLTHEYEERKQAEKDEQRRIREQMREEEAAQREIERAVMEAEREAARYERALAKARSEIEKTVGEKHDKLQSEIARLQELLHEAQSNRERVQSRAEMTRSGYVYVISNVGSFGDEVYKIGMTRRIDPMDRVYELSDASVPFSFDVHALIFTQDAPGLETALHQVFAHRRVNRVNQRKEFFRVSLADIREEARKHMADVQFTMKAKAEEYWKTKAILAQEAKGIPA